MRITCLERLVCLEERRVFFVVRRSLWALREERVEHERHEVRAGAAAGQSLLPPQSREMVGFAMSIA